MTPFRPYFHALKYILYTSSTVASFGRFIVDEIDMEIEAYTLHGNDADSDYYLLPIDEVDVDYFRIVRP